MIAARIGHDHFLVWQLPVDQALRFVPTAAQPLVSNGHAWLLFAMAELQRVRVFGCPVPGQRRVAGWLIPCHAPGGGLGNFFLQALSDDPLVVLAYRALGMRQVQHARLTISHQSVRAPGVRARLGHFCDLPELAWFERDRCGLIAHTSTVIQLPLVKRGWHWQARAMTVDSPFAAALGALPVAAIDCSQDLAIWAAPAVDTCDTTRGIVGTKGTAPP